MARTKEEELPFSVKEGRSDPKLATESFFRDGWRLVQVHLKQTRLAQSDRNQAQKEVDIDHWAAQERKDVQQREEAWQ